MKASEFIPQILAGLSGLAIGIVATLIVQHGQCDLKAAKAQVKAVEHVVTTERAAADIGQAVAADVANRQAAIRTVTKTILQKVPDHVPLTHSPADQLTWGDVRVHDEAAAGVPDLSIAPGQPDAAVSPFTKTDEAFAIAWNYGLYHECATDKDGLQDFARRQRDLSLKAAGLPPEKRTEPLHDGE